MVGAKSRKKNRAIFTVLLLICVVGFWFFENFYTPATYSIGAESDIKSQMSPTMLPSSTTGDIIVHNYYALSYNEPFEQAEWVAYELKKEHLTNDDRKRPYFIEDPKVKTKSADWRNYRGSGYDRGHLCPAGDRRFSEQAYNETFYTSNVSPQNRDFNAGIWNRLEMQVRQWAKRYGSLFVVTGGVLEAGLKQIGEEDVDVPNYYYKIIVKEENTRLQAIAFLMPGRSSSKPIREFTVPIDKIEKMTGIDFFEKLPIEITTELERSVNLEGWRF
ncbi:DNA/RNA non-specific endonuclease [uncultured Kriegella sp.]|uniref:DNA/RNA non-specific endonuclease n=1 Tax=uncultured Kriegella sp. TaxID=1798910 RepID=UPI0030DBC766|tara:strand:+ start:26451 stop:27272 length:822 start_codon:yes stop_codon:yes gene_type:complete